MIVIIAASIAIYVVIRLILDYLALQNMILMHVQQPWLNEIALGHKTIEGRTGEMCGLKIGEIVEFTDGEMKIHAFITRAVHYDTLEEYLIHNWIKAAPQAQTYLEAKRMYEEIAMPNGELVFSEERIKRRGGINALHLQLVHLF